MSTKPHFPGGAPLRVCRPALTGAALLALCGCGPELLLLLGAFDEPSGGGDSQAAVEPRQRPREIEGVEGCGGPSGAGPAGLVTRAVRYDARVSGEYVSATMEVHLCSGSETVEEATLRFPLPRGAVIHGAEILLPEQGRWEPAETLGRSEGELAYEGVVHPPEPRRFDDPLLVQQIGPDLYRARVFPVDAWLGRRIRIHYAHLLERTDEGLDLEIALEDPDALPLDPVRGLRVSVASDPGAFADGLWSLNGTEGASAFDAGSGSGWVELEAGRPAFEDLTLHLVPREAAPEAGALRYRPAAEGLAPHTLVHWTPRALEEDPRLAAQPRSVIFVIDVSGSMAGRKLEQTRRAVIRMLRALGEEDRFSLVAFDDWPLVFEATMRSGGDVDGAVRWVEGLTAGGSTDLAAALVRAAEIGLAGSRDAGRPLDLLIVTDGQPNVGAVSPAEILAVLGEATDRLGGAVRVHACGIGLDLGQGFLDDLVMPTGGEATFALEDGEITGQLLELFDRVRVGGLSDLSFLVEGDAGEASHWRRVLPGTTLSSGLSGEVSDPLRLSLEGFAPDGSLVGASLELDVAETDGDEIDRIAPALAALAWADRLERRIDEEGESDELVREAVLLARAYGIVTRYSAMLALERPEMYEAAGIQRLPRDPAGIALAPAEASLVDESRIGGEGTADGLSLAAPGGCSASGASHPASASWVALALLVLGVAAQMRRRGQDLGLAEGRLGSTKGGAALALAACLALLLATLLGCSGSTGRAHEDDAGLDGDADRWDGQDANPDGDGGRGQDADGGTNDGGDADRPADNAGDADLPAPDAGEQTCTAALGCIRVCAGDMVCMAGCAAEVCSASRVALDALLLCAADRCTPICLDQSSPDCLTCLATSCALEGLACVRASCAE